MEKILAIIFNNRIEIYGSLFDFINYNTECMEINSVDIIRLNNELNNKKDFVNLEIKYKNDEIENIKLKYIDVISNWDSIGKKFNNIILKEELKY